MNEIDQKTDAGTPGFTLALALVDALPVLFFGISCIVLGMLFQSVLFVIGAVLMFFGGLGKVLWKLFLAVSKKDIAFLDRQFRYSMCAGFVLIVISLIAGWRRISFSAIGAAVLSMPSLLFFVIAVAGLVAMGVLASKLDSSVAKNNWIEQCVNSVAQLSLLLALLFLL